MKKSLIVLSIISLLVISSLVAVSASPVSGGKVVIAGKIYDSPNFETANGVADANVNATCNSNVEYTTSLADGTYSVTFTLEECPNNSTVIVWAEKDGISNSEEGIVHDYTAMISELYLGVVNVALIPEFGLIVGLVTIFGAVGVFFVIRKH